MRGSEERTSVTTGRLQLGAALLLFVLVSLTYANSFAGAFLADSGAIVLEDPRVHEVSRENLDLIFRQQYWYPTADSGLYRPLVTLSFLFNYAVMGNADRPAGYHWVNLSLHIVNVMLVWLIALTMWRRPLPAFFTAAIFAVHPVNVETVTNIAGRPDLMAGLGVLLGLLLHAHLPDVHWQRRIPWILGILLAALFGLFSKENAVVLPAAMLLYDLLFRTERPHRWRTSVPGYLAVGTALLTNLWVRHGVLARLPSFDQPFVDNPLVGADFLTARWTALKVIFKYVGILLWPQSLSWDYSYNQIPLATWGVGLAALAGVIALLALLLWLHRRNSPACFFGVFFFLALLPTSNLVLIIGSIMAERFLYLPSIGFAGCVVACGLALVRTLVPDSARNTRTAIAVLAVVVIALALRTRERNHDWADGERFWKSAQQTSPNSFKTHMAPIYGWSQTGFTAGNIDRAIDQAEQAVAIVKDLPPEKNTTLPLTTLGTLYRIKADVMMYKRPDDVPGLYRRSLETLKRAEELDQVFSEQRRRKDLAQGWLPNQIKARGNAYIYQNLSDTNRRLGRFPEAVQALSHLMELTPLNSEVYSQIAEVETVQRNPEAAIMALWQSFALTQAPEAERTLMLAYRASYPGGCAETGTGTLKTNRSCSVVKMDACKAYGNLVRVLANTGRAGEAAKFRQTAAHDYDCLFQEQIQAP